jgi:hypothetical protein
MPLAFGRKAKLAENREMKAGNSQDYSPESLSHALQGFGGFFA